MPPEDDAEDASRAACPRRLPGSRLRSVFTESLKEIASQAGHPDDVARRILDLRRSMIRGILGRLPGRQPASPDQAAETAALQQELLRAVHEAANDALRQIGRPSVPDDDLDGAGQDN